MYTTSKDWLSADYNVHHKYKMGISRPQSTAPTQHGYHEQQATMYTTSIEWLSAGHNVHHQHRMVISKPQCTPPAWSSYNVHNGMNVPNHNVYY